MPLNQSQVSDIGAYLHAGAGLPLQPFTSGVAITTGDVIDRSTMQYPYSALLVIPISFTVASGASNAENITVVGTVNSSLVVGMTSPVLVETFTVVVPWKSNGTLKEAVVQVPLNLNAALEFIQLSSLKLNATSSPGTYSALEAGATFVFGGEPILPDGFYNRNGAVGFSS